MLLCLILHIDCGYFILNNSIFLTCHPKLVTGAGIHIFTKLAVVIGDFDNNFVGS